MLSIWRISPLCLLCLQLNAFRIADLFLGAVVSAGRAERQSRGKHGAGTPGDPTSLLPPVSGKTVARRGRAEPVEGAEGRKVLQVRMEMHGRISQQSSVVQPRLSWNGGNKGNHERSLQKSDLLQQSGWENWWGPSHPAPLRMLCPVSKPFPPTLGHPPNSPLPCTESFSLSKSLQNPFRARFNLSSGRRS